MGPCPVPDTDALTVLVLDVTTYAQRRSIKRNDSNEQYQAQDLPYASFPSPPGVVFRAGIAVGGRRCPRCSRFIAVTSKVVRLARPERNRWWVHQRCFDLVVIDLGTGR